MSQSSSVGPASIARRSSLRGRGIPGVSLTACMSRPCLRGHGPRPAPSSASLRARIGSEPDVATIRRATPGAGGRDDPPAESCMALPDRDRPGIVGHSDGSGRRALDLPRRSGHLRRHSRSRAGIVASAAAPAAPRVVTVTARHHLVEAPATVASDVVTFRSNDLGPTEHHPRPGPRDDDVLVRRQPPGETETDVERWFAGGRTGERPESPVPTSSSGSPRTARSASPGRWSRGGASCGWRTPVRGTTSSSCAACARGTPPPRPWPRRRPAVSLARAPFDPVGGLSDVPGSGSVTTTLTLPAGDYFVGGATRVPFRVVSAQR